MTFESEGLLIVAIYIWLPPASYVVFLTTLVSFHIANRNGIYPLTAFTMPSAPAKPRAKTPEVTPSEKGGEDPEPMDVEMRMVTHSTCQIKRMEDPPRYQITLQLKMDDKMNRQLTADINDEDSAVILAEELVHYGFINMVCIMTRTLPRYLPKSWCIMGLLIWYEYSEIVVKKCILWTSWIFVTVGQSWVGIFCLCHDSFKLERQQITAKLLFENRGFKSILGKETAHLSRLLDFSRSVIFSAVYCILLRRNMSCVIPALLTRTQLSSVSECSRVATDSEKQGKWWKKNPCMDISGNLKKIRK